MNEVQNIRKDDKVTDKTKDKVNKEHDQVSDSFVAETQSLKKPKIANGQIPEANNSEASLPIKSKQGSLVTGPKESGNRDKRAPSENNNQQNSLEKFSSAVKPKEAESNFVQNTTSLTKSDSLANKYTVRDASETTTRLLAAYKPAPSGEEAKYTLPVANQGKEQIKIAKDMNTPAVADKSLTAKKDKDQFNHLEQHVGPGSITSSEKDQPILARGKAPSGGSSNSGGELARVADPQVLPLAHSPYPKSADMNNSRSSGNQSAENNWSQLAQKFRGGDGEKNLAWAGSPSNKDGLSIKDGGGEFGKQKFEPGSSGQHKDESNSRQGASDNAGWSGKDSGSSKSHENKSASDNASSAAVNSYSREQESERGQSKQESFKPEGRREDTSSFNNAKLASVEGVRSSEPVRVQQPMHARESAKGEEAPHGGNGMESKGIQSIESSAKPAIGGKDHSTALESVAADKMARTSTPSTPEFTGKNNSGMHASDTVSGGKDKKGFDVAPGEQSTAEAKGSGKFSTQDGIGSGKAGDKLDVLHDFMTKGDGKGKGGFSEDPRWTILNDGKGKSFDDKSIFSGLKGLGDGTGLSGKQQDISFLTDKFSGIRHTSESIVSTSMSMMASLINAAQEKIIKNIQIPNISEASLIGLPIDNSIKLSNQVSSKPLGLGDSFDVKGLIIKNSNEPTNKDLATNKDLGISKEQGIKEQIGKESGLKDPPVAGSQISKEQGLKDQSAIANQIGKDPGTKEPGVDPLTPKLEPKGLGSIDTAGRDGKNAEPSAKDTKSSLPDGKFASDGRALGDSGKTVSDERKPQDIRSSIDALLINLANGVTPAVKFVDNQIENAANLNIKIPAIKEQPNQIEQGAGESVSATSEPTSQSRQDTASRKRYVVKPVDTISSIAAAVLGDERYAKLLVTINRANVEVVTRNFKEVVILRPGQSLLLPSLNEMEVHKKAYFPAPSTTEL